MSAVLRETPQELLGADALRANPNAPVMVCADLRALQYADKLAGNIYACVTWHGDWRNYDWLALTDRKILVWCEVWPLAVHLASNTDNTTKILPTDVTPEDFEDYEAFKAWARENVRELTRENAISEQARMDSMPPEPPIEAYEEVREIAETKPTATYQERLPALDFADYVNSFESPDYLIDGLLISSRVYALTALTGHCKTAIATYMGLAVACGQKFSGRDTVAKRVLYLSGENDEDQKARTIATSTEFGLLPGIGQFRVRAGAQGIGSLIPELDIEFEENGPYGLVVVDTSAAFFGGSDEIDNVEAKHHAQFFRDISRMPGNPTVLVLCHPTKAAGKDSLLPRGGGAFLNDIDGNLTAFLQGERVTMHRLGKFRGPPFEPMDFAVKPVILKNYKDAKGRPVESVVVTPMTDYDVVKAEHAEWTDENKLMYEMLHHPNSSFTDWAEACGWRDKNGNALKSKVSRLIADLHADKLVEKERKKWILTNAGRKAAASIT